MVTKSLQAGVTLIEMIVVVGIIAAVSSVIIFNYSDFSTNVSLRNLTQEVALSIRQAQTYATSVRPIAALGGLSSRTFSGYGMSFSTVDHSTQTDPSFPDSKQFILFADIPRDATQTPDRMYSQAPGESCGAPSSSTIECIQAIQIATADKIVGICSGATPYSADDFNCPSNGSVDITFIRPNPDANIITDSSGTVSSYAKIVFESAKGLRHAVVIWNTGQISVQ